METLKVPKVGFDVMIELRDGSRMTGRLFLASATQFHAGHERVGELLRGRDTWVPLALSEGGTRLIMKSAIVQIRMMLEQGLQDFDPDGSIKPILRPVKARVTLVTGETIEGRVLVTPDLSRDPRLLDWLNRSQDFLPLATDEQLAYIMPCALCSIEELPPEPEF